MESLIDEELEMDDVESADSCTVEWNEEERYGEAHRPVPSRYSVVERIFLEGTFGKVTVRLDELLGRKVVLKAASSALFAVAQLRAEEIALSKIRSKHVVEIYDRLLDSDGNVVGIVEEYLPGGDLRGFSQSGFDQEKYLTAIYQIASGIADIHAHGIVHSDIKLQNMKADGSGVIKIFDFGFSRAEGEIAEAGLRGTEIYGGPELYWESNPMVKRYWEVEPEVRKIEPSVDTYAFGVCCWFLATPHIPWVLREEPPQCSCRADSLATVAGTLPSELLDVLDATLEPDPIDRPSMNSIRNAIGDLVL